MMKTFMSRVLVFFLSIIAGIHFTGCPDDNPVTPSDEEFNETIIEEVTSTIGADGGTLSLADGTRIVIKPGALSGNSTITLQKIDGERYFDAENRNAYNLTASTEPAALTLEFPVRSNGEAEDFGILNYDPESMEGEEMPFSYDAQAGKLSLEVTPNRAGASDRPSAAKLAGSLNKRSRWVTEDEPLVEPDRKVVAMSLPFYQQDELTCWATSIKMLARAYDPKSTSQVYDYLKYAGYPPTSGPNPFMYRIKAPATLRRYVDASATGSMYWRATSAFNNLVMQIDSGRPVMMGRKGHSFVVIGYEKVTALRGPASYRFLVHDPADDNTGNQWKDWSWLEDRTYADLTMTEIWIPKLPSDARALQTVGLPLSAASGAIRFLRTLDEDGNMQPVGTIGFDVESEKGYSWVNERNKTSYTIRPDAETLELRLPLWNADRNATASISLRVSVRQKNGGEKYNTHEFNTLSISTSPTEAILQIPVNEFRQNQGDSTYTLKVELLNKDIVVIDQFSVDFIIGPGAPYITSIEPEHAKPGTRVAIIGKFFGEEASGNSVQFNGKQATAISSWSDTRIEVEVPENATSGDVIVTVGDMESNGFPFIVDDDLDLYPMLQTSVVCGTKFFGIHNMSDGSTLSEIYISSGEAGIPLEWSGTAFSTEHTWREPDAAGGYRDFSISVTGNVAADGRSVANIRAVSKETWVAPDDAWTQITEEELSASDIPFSGILPSSTNPDIEFLQYFSAGTTLKGKSFRAVYKITVDGETQLEYVDSDWESDLLPPELDILFARYKD